MIITIYDTECNSLDTERGFIMEVAWARFSVGPVNWRCLSARSEIVKWGDDFPYEVNAEALAVTGLTREFCEWKGSPAVKAIPDLFMDLASSDFVAGHNILKYDNPMLLNNNKRIFADDSMVLEIDSIYSKMNFLDSFVHIDYPPFAKFLTLKYLALEHGYVLTGAHEALADVFACAHVFKQYDLEKIIENSKQPIQKRFMKLPFGDPRVDVLKKNRFRWEPENKIWYKEVRANKVDDLHNDLGFMTELFVVQKEFAYGPF